eukprot:g25934.t1
MSATVASNCGLESEPFIVEKLKGGCIIVATLFTTFIVVILHLTGQNLPKGIQVIYCMDCSLFNTKGKVSTTSILELQYADNNAITAHSAEDLQCILDDFAKAYKCL